MTQRNKQAVILAGGLGTRLRPFTEAIPKPLLPVGEKSILELQILRLKKYGFTEIILATNYKSEYIEAFFGGGGRLGVEITISKEDKPLGTCGPLSLIRDRITGPFIVMNGDILTTIDFARLYDFALESGSSFTVATKEIVMPFAFGNVCSEGNFITAIEEKPDMKTEVVAGIYVMTQDIFERIPGNQYFGMDELIIEMLKDDDPIAKYVISGLWFDIGQQADYEEAQKAYETHFKD